MSMSISSMSTAAQMLQSRDKTFDALDTNKDGVVDASELAAAKKGDDGKKTQKADDLFSKIDTDGDGKISRAESDAFKQKLSDGMKGTLLQAQEHGGTDASAATPSEDDMFAKLDTNGDGSVDKSEFEAGFKAHGHHHHHHRPSADEMLAKLDTDGDGAISKAEFEAGPSRAKNSGASSASSSGDPASQLLDLLKKAGDDASSPQGTTQISMVAVLLQVQETSAIAA